MDHLLQVDRLNFSFSKRNLGEAKRKTKVLHDISFFIQAGETLGLLGETGSGKSTLAKCLMRFYRPDSGRVFFNGKETTKIRGNRLFVFRREMQMIFQDPADSLNPRQTAADILGEPLIIHAQARGSQRRKRVLELLDQVGLPKNCIKKFPFEFSGGQKQRLGIARALALKPKMLICDEAVSALDVSIQSQILNLLLDLQKELEMSYLFISHDLSVVQHMSNQVAVMRNGRLVEMASSHQLYRAARHPYTKLLMYATFSKETKVIKPFHEPLLEQDSTEVFREVEKGHWVLGDY